jgi:hypothetical protein
MNLHCVIKPENHDLSPENFSLALNGEYGLRKNIWRTERERKEGNKRK